MEGIIKSSDKGEIYNLTTHTDKPEFLGEKEIAKFKK